ncbi:MAG: ATP phosphoribosyltransferase [Proteobacteria bacterium]|nr:ATP phosphoribosyltransferase [Pseudomonadota bacterium]
MTSRPLSRVPPGVQVVTGDAARLTRQVERTVLEVFDARGYAEVLLPMFDYAELFEQGLGASRAPRTYRFTDHEGHTLALRPELTTLVARTVATRLAGQEPPFRVAYSGEIFRWDPPRRGQPAELRQIGVEHVGGDRGEADLEVLLVCAEALRALGVEGARIVLGHVDFLRGIVDGLALAPDAADELYALLDHRDRDGIERFLGPLSTADKVRRFCRITTLTGGREVVDEALAVVNNEVSHAALAEMGRLLDAAADAGLGDMLQIDLGSVAGFDYYTGPTFRVFAPGVGSPLGGGGRYDRLMARFGRDLPAVGFSLCVDWLVELLGDSGDAGLPASNGAVTVALSKGRLAGPALERFAAARVTLPDGWESSRRLWIDDVSGRCRFILVKPADVPTYVEYGIAEIGIAGGDVLLESGADVHAPLDLGFGRCRLAVAGAPDAPIGGSGGTVRVGTKYPRTAEAWFLERGLSVDIIPLSGSVELAAVAGLADCIVDVVETGRTLRENGLDVLEDVAECTARAIVNRAAWQLRGAEVRSLIDDLTQETS